MCVFKNHAFICFGRPPSWSGTELLLTQLLVILICENKYGLNFSWSLRNPSKYKCTTSLVCYWCSGAVVAGGAAIDGEAATGKLLPVLQRLLLLIPDSKIFDLKISEQTVPEIRTIEWRVASIHNPWANFFQFSGTTRHAPSLNTYEKIYYPSVIGFK
jgi:hypothetical protein